MQLSYYPLLSSVVQTMIEATFAAGYLADTKEARAHLENLDLEPVGIYDQVEREIESIGLMNIEMLIEMLIEGDIDLEESGISPDLDAVLTYLFEQVHQ
jgi:hypothetical protein